MVDILTGSNPVLTAKIKNMETKKGFVNLHIDLETKQIFCSQKPYETKEEAEKGIFIGYGIFKLGIIEIEYPIEEIFTRKRI